MNNERGELLIMYVLVGLLTASLMTIHLMLMGCKETTKAGIRTCVEETIEARPEAPKLPQVWEVEIGAVPLHEGDGTHQEP